MRKFLLASIAAAHPAAYFNTNAGVKLYVCATAQPADLNSGTFAALTWVQVKGVGSFGQTGASTNILTYDTWDSDVTQKAKGMTDAGSPEIECARIPTDPGQIILRAAALTNFNYAFKIVRNDAAIAGGTPTTIYNRGLVTGPVRPNGRNEDFDLEKFTLALQQREVVIDPTVTGNPPLETAPPVISGTLVHGNVLSSTTGTFSGDATITYVYQWYRGGEIIGGAQASTYLLQTLDVGDVITVSVTATNASGFATATSAPTAAIT